MMLKNGCSDSEQDEKLQLDQKKTIAKCEIGLMLR